MLAAIAMERKLRVGSSETRRSKRRAKTRQGMGVGIDEDQFRGESCSFELTVGRARRGWTQGSQGD